MARCAHCAAEGADCQTREGERVCETCLCEVLQARVDNLEAEVRRLRRELEVHDNGAERRLRAVADSEWRDTDAVDHQDALRVGDIRAVLALLDEARGERNEAR